MNARETLIEQPWQAIKKQRLFRDRFLRRFVVVAVLLLILEWLLLGFQLRPTGFVVPFEYTSGAEFRLGEWWRIFGYGLFSLLVTVGNIVLAAMSFEKSRIASFFLVLSAVILNIFTIVITYTLLAQVG
jgi:hypothetical protein